MVVWVVLICFLMINVCFHQYKLGSFCKRIYVTPSIVSALMLWFILVAFLTFIYFHGLEDLVVFSLRID